MKKFALGVEYDGSFYHGWQRQKKVLSVQEELESSLSKVANHKIDLICAGRTDAGVHSIGQVVHFSTKSTRKNFSWIRGANTYLSKNISVQWIKQVPEYFNARYSAITRSYIYIIYNYHFRTALFNSRTHYIHKKLDIEKMNSASQILLGSHDFSSFRGANCQSSSPWRHILNISVRSLYHFIIINITANSFLYHMVRNIVGSLIEIGSAKKPVSWMQELLKKKNRIYAGPTVISKGLYLSAVEYPSFFNLPKSFSSLFFFNKI